jgi:intracellular multiplication protein IcmV
VGVFRGRYSAHKNPEEKPGKIKGFVKKRFNPARWLSLPEITRSASHIVDMVKVLLSLKKPNSKRVETFLEAQARLHVSDSQLADRHKSLRFASKCYFFLGFLVLLYAYHLVFNSGVVAGGLCTSTVSGPLFALSFKNSFNAYQIRRRRLGCTVEEWFRDNFGMAKIWFRD